jgi:3-oxoacyl-[acyl-carrier protein] reductase
VSTRTALVTGGTRGIGLGIAQALAREGWNLLLCGTRSDSEVAEVVEALRKRRVEVAYVRADLASQSDRARLLDAAARCGVDALVNNAGRAPRVRADLLDAQEDSFEELIRTNLQGPYFLTQGIARQMIERRAGAGTGASKEVPYSSFAAIVFITSVSSTMASLNRGEYCVSKAGLSMAAQLFALRLAPEGIPVYEVRPGIIETDMTAPVRERYDREIANGLVPERRWGRPEDVGKVVAALLRGDLPYTTGTVITVDGGLSIARL